MSARLFAGKCSEPQTALPALVGGDWVADGNELVYVVPVPAGDLLPFIGAGEELNGRYWLGDYSSKRQFRIVHVAKGW